MLRLRPRHKEMREPVPQDRRGMCPQINPEGDGTSVDQTPAESAALTSEQVFVLEL